MFDSPRFRSAALVCLSAFMLAACGKKEADAPGPLAVDGGVLHYVPSDTPYVFASGAPMPDDVFEKIEPATDQMLKAYQTVLREIVRETFEEYEGRAEINGEEVDVESERIYAVTEELISLMSVEGMRDAGITRESRFAFYGNGMLPVWRIQVADTELFDGAIARFEAAAGASMDTAEIDGQSYRYLGDDDLSMIIGLFGDHAVMTIAPSGFGDDELRNLLGIEPPASSIVDSGRLDSLIREYELGSYMVGFFDIVRIAETFLGQPSALDQVMFDAAGYDASEFSNVCKAELIEMAGIMPIAVFGYDTVTTDEVSGKAVLALREDIAAEMTGLAAAVPGLGLDSGGFGSFGVSFNIMALRSFYESRLDALDNDPFECEELQEMHASLAEGRAALQQPMPPFVYGLRGMNIIIDDIGDLDFSNPRPPENFDATVLLAMEDAPALVMMGAMFLPELASLDLQPDGKAVPLDVPQAGMVSDSAYVAMNNEAIAIAVGKDAEARAAGALELESVSPPLSMGLSVDAARYYELIGESMAEPSGSADGLSPAAQEAMGDAMIAVSKLYDRMIFGILFTEKGIVMESTATLAD